MDLHVKTHQLKNLFLVQQLRHETRISLIHTNLRHEFHEFTLMDRNPSKVRGTSCNSCLAFVSFVSLRLEHGDEMAQLILNIAGCRNGVGNFLSQYRLIALPKSVKRLSD